MLFDPRVAQGWGDVFAPSMRRARVDTAFSSSTTKEHRRHGGTREIMRVQGPLSGGNAPYSWSLNNT